MQQQIESVLEWQLKLVVWEFFCTLTWSTQSRGTIKSRRRHVTRWLLQWAKRERPHMPGMRALDELAYVIRWERGEIGGLPHCHILVARFPRIAINRHRCMRQIKRWERYGISRIRLYNGRNRNVERYLSKGKFSPSWTQGANAYELKKFNSADDVYISPGAWREMVASRTTGKRMRPLSA